MEVDMLNYEFENRDKLKFIRFLIQGTISLNTSFEVSLKCFSFSKETYLKEVKLLVTEKYQYEQLEKSVLKAVLKEFSDYRVYDATQNSIDF